MTNNLFKPYLEKIEDEKDRKKVRDVYKWIEDQFPDLQREVKWSTPLYSHHGTFIIGVKPARKHFSINPEFEGIDVFSDKIKKAGYTHEKMTYKIKYSDEVNYGLLKEIIEYNIEDKKDTVKFWR
ncbi:MAG: iron chaperone [Jeotgalicoccus sp.]